MAAMNEYIEMVLGMPRIIAGILLDMTEQAFLLWINLNPWIKIPIQISLFCVTVLFAKVMWKHRDKIFEVSDPLQ